MLLLLSGCGAPRSSPAFTDLSGRARSLADLKGHPAVLVFWRSDCGPCQIELKAVEGMEQAAAPAPLVTVALQDRATAAAYLKTLPKQPRTTFVAPAATNADVEKILLAWGGEPPRLPLAVAINARGSICRRHSGLLGTDRITDWVRQCS
jgi:thiol-disulfide isomerase/thioredoxin